MSDRKFDLIPNRDEGLGYLQEAANTIASVILWTKGGERYITTTLHMLSQAEQVIYTTEPKDFNQMRFVEDLVKSGSRECFFSVSLVNANIFFKATFVGYDHGLKFKFPAEVFKVQRRASMRLTLDDEIPFSVKFTDPLLGTPVQKSAIDISSGGLAFRVEPGEAPTYQAPLIIDDMTFNIRLREIKTKGEIRHQSPIKSKTGLVTGTKIGVLFQGLSADDTQLIATYVLEESRKAFAKFAGG